MKSLVVKMPLGNIYNLEDVPDLVGYINRNKRVFTRLSNQLMEDLEKLGSLGISLEGRIAISRYGKIFRGNRLKNCEAAGAVGVIMFTDPAQVAPEGTEPSSVYPNTFFLPPSGVQRGTTFIGGDPLSPTWTSVAGAYRLSVNETDDLPKIPAQPIGYGDASRLY